MGEVLLQRVVQHEVDAHLVVGGRPEANRRPVVGAAPVEVVDARGGEAVPGLHVEVDLWIVVLRVGVVGVDLSTQRATGLDHLVGTNPLLIWLGKNN